MCGLRHEAIQRRLLSETDLTYAKAMEIAQGMEAADRHSKSLNQPSEPLRATPLAVVPTTRQRSRTPCATTAKGRGTSHRHAERSRRASSQQARLPNLPADVPVDVSTTSAELIGYRRKIWTKIAVTNTTYTERASEPIAVDVFIDGKQLAMELDTGAAVSIISDESLFPDRKLLLS